MPAEVNEGMVDTMFPTSGATVIILTDLELPVRFSLP